MALICTETKKEKTRNVRIGRVLCHFGNNKAQSCRERTSGRKQEARQPNREIDVEKYRAHPTDKIKNNSMKCYDPESKRPDNDRLKQLVQSNLRQDENKTHPWQLDR